MNLLLKKNSPRVLRTLTLRLLERSHADAKGITHNIICGRLQSIAQLFHRATCPKSRHYLDTYTRRESCLVVILHRHLRFAQLSIRWFYDVKT